MESLQNSGASDTSDWGSLSRVNSGDMKKINSGGELKINEEQAEAAPFKDKVLGTSKLQEENNNKGDAAGGVGGVGGGGATEGSPRKREFLRMQSQIALPVVKNE